MTLESLKTNLVRRERRGEEERRRKRGEMDFNWPLHHTEHRREENGRLDREAGETGRGELEAR